MTAVILSGGENTRIPLIKGLIEVGGRSIIASQITTLSDFFDKIIISTNSPELYFKFGLPMIGDLSEQRGPMTGIYSALASSKADEVFVFACDMPFVKNELIKLIIDNYIGKAIAPIWMGRPEPLIGIYPKGLLPIMEKLLTKGRVGLVELLQDSGAAFVSEELVNSVDPDGRSFVNINTLEDLNSNILGD